MLSATLVTVVVGCGRGAPPLRDTESTQTTAKPTSERVSLEEQLRQLEERGIALGADRSVDELLLSYSREQYESKPYGRLLAVMGGEVEGEPYGRRFSDDIWYLDTECIDGDGAYVAIAKDFARLAGDALPLESIEDRVDHDAGTAWLQFTVRGTQHRWTASIEDDWIDPSIVSRFVELLRAHGAHRRFTYMDDGGQAALIGVATPEQLQALNRLDGVSFKWLD